MTQLKPSDSWKTIPWKKFRKMVFRLQCRIWKAVRANDLRKAKSLQRLLIKSVSARYVAIRQVTQLNAGKKTAGIDGKKSLNFSERHALSSELKSNALTWTHNKLRKIPIPKKDGTQRILKVPTIADRAWQCLIKLAIEPAHEAMFHARSYGFRVGRCAHDAQQYLRTNLSSNKRSKTKRVIELDIEKCFDRIDHKELMKRVIAPSAIKTGLWKCLKSGVNPEFPELGTPQGGVVSPVLANIALNGIEEIHTSVRYADDMVFILKPEDNADVILTKIATFLAQRGLNISQRKTRITAATDGFNFLGWYFKVLPDGRFKCYPSVDNRKAVLKKIKTIARCSNYGAEVRASKIAPIVRGWRNYHRHCDMSKNYLWHVNKRTHDRFLKQKSINRYKAKKLIQQAFPAVGYRQGGFRMVKGDKSPYDGDLIYWSQRKSRLYEGYTAKALIKQNHACGYCGTKFADDERIHLHHKDGNHLNWRPNNLMAIHESCHDLIHIGKSAS